MATTNASVHGGTGANATVYRGAVGGIVAGLVFGLLIQFRLERMATIGALYTLGGTNLVVGWAAHMVHSVLFGAAFGVLADTGVVRARLATPAALLGGTLAFAVALWAVNIVVVWPLWLDAVAVTNAPPLPNLAVMPLVGHLVWGGIVGVVLALWQR